MGFQLYEGDREDKQAPTVSIDGKGYLRFNKAAGELLDNDCAELYYDAELGWIGVQPKAASDSRSLLPVAVHRHGQKGIKVRGFLARFQLDCAASKRYPLHGPKVDIPVLYFRLDEGRPTKAEPPNPSTPRRGRRKAGEPADGERLAQEYIKTQHDLRMQINANEIYKLTHWDEPKIRRFVTETLARLRVPNAQNTGDQP